MLRSFEEIKEALHKGELTLPQLVENYLEQIEKNKHLNMYVEVWAEESLARAKDPRQLTDYWLRTRYSLAAQIAMNLPWVRPMKLPITVWLEMR